MYDHPQKLSWDEYVTSVEEKKDHLLLDVREDDEWKRGHVRGAVHIPREELPARISKVVPDTSTLIVTCCGSGRRAALAQDTLHKLGYDNVMCIVGDPTEHYRHTQ